MLLAILLSGAPLESASAEPACNRLEVVLAGRTVDKPSIKPLADAPPARHILGVMHWDFDGCVKPIVVSETVGKR